MKKLLIIALILPVQTAFAWTNEDFRVANKNIIVELFDSASDGCWTNLGEVKRYTVDKLSFAGANVVKEHSGRAHPDNKNYWFAVSVIGYRLNSGICIGSISTELYTAARFDDFHFAYVHESNMLVNSNRGSNLNNQVLSMIGDVFRKIK